MTQLPAVSACPPPILCPSGTPNAIRVSDGRYIARTVDEHHAVARIIIFALFSTVFLLATFEPVKQSVNDFINFSFHFPPCAGADTYDFRRIVHDDMASDVTCSSPGL